MLWSYSPCFQKAEDTWRAAAAAKRSAKTAVDEATAAAVSSVAVERPEYAALGNQCFVKQNDGFEYKVRKRKEIKREEESKRKRGEIGGIV